MRSMASRAYHSDVTQTPFLPDCPLFDGWLESDVAATRYRPFVDFGAPIHSSVVVWPGAFSTIEGITARFLDHYKAWRLDSLFDSLPDQMRAHRSYNAIIDLGERAVPLIAAQLRREPSFLFLALEDITGVDPVPEQCHGKLHETVLAWLKWLQK